MFNPSGPSATWTEKQRPYLHDDHLCKKPLSQRRLHNSRRVEDGLKETADAVERMAPAVAAEWQFVIIFRLLLHMDTYMHFENLDSVERIAASA
jgi:hypothetical protein